MRILQHTCNLSGQILLCPVLEGKLIMGSYRGFELAPSLHLDAPMDLRREHVDPEEEIMLYG